MTIKTVSSENVRDNLRDLLDDVNRGESVMIERYRKLAAVLISPRDWAHYRQLHKAELDRIRAEMDAGNFKVWDEVRAEWGVA